MQAVGRGGQRDGQRDPPGPPGRASTPAAAARWRGGHGPERSLRRHQVYGDVGPRRFRGSSPRLLARVRGGREGVLNGQAHVRDPPGVSAGSAGHELAQTSQRRSSHGGVSDPAQTVHRDGVCERRLPPQPPPHRQGRHGDASRAAGVAVHVQGAPVPPQHQHHAQGPEEQERAVDGAPPLPGKAVRLWAGTPEAGKCHHDRWGRGGGGGGCVVCCCSGGGKRM